jgi:hypothetical protein
MMAYTFTVSDDLKVIVKQGNKKVDEVGPFGDAEGAEYWATEIAKKYDENPTYVYPGEEPEVNG